MLLLVGPPTGARPYRPGGRVPKVGGNWGSARPISEAPADRHPYVYHPYGRATPETRPRPRREPQRLALNEGEGTPR